MNKLIFIGNGFDLAHGLRTSYYDFYLSFLKEKIDETIRLGKFQKGSKSTNSVKDFDGHLKISIPKSSYSNRFIENLSKIKNFHDLLNFIKEESIQIKFPNSNSILKRTYEELDHEKWVDIEDLYFQNLFEIYRDNNGGIRLNRGLREKVITLNKELDFIKEHLKKYLEEITKPNDLFDNIKSAHFWTSLFKHYNGENPPEKLLIVNFNYTNTLDKYGDWKNLFGDLKNEIQSIEVIHVHGSINEGIDSMIFGYGDDSHTGVSEMYALDNPDLRKNFKRGNYGSNGKFTTLARFIDSGIFDLDIIGHSCGLSDKHIFKLVVENQNCRSAYCYHYTDGDGYNDFEDKFRLLTGYFGIQSRLIDKIQSRDLCRSMSDLALARVN